MATELVATDDDLIAFPYGEVRCCVCGDPSDYCQGHGEIGDPVGFETIQRHEEGDHSECWDGLLCDS